MAVCGPVPDGLSTHPIDINTWETNFDVYSYVYGPLEDDHLYPDMTAAEYLWYLNNQCDPDYDPLIRFDELEGIEAIRELCGMSRESMSNPHWGTARHIKKALEDRARLAAKTPTPEPEPVSVELAAHPPQQKNSAHEPAPAPHTAVSAPGAAPPTPRSTSSVPPVPPTARPTAASAHEPRPLSTARAQPQSQARPSVAVSSPLPPPLPRVPLPQRGGGLHDPYRDFQRARAAQRETRAVPAAVADDELYRLLRQLPRELEAHQVVAGPSTRTIPSQTTTASMRPAAPPASHAIQYPPHVSPPGIPQARVKENVRPLFPQAAPQALQPALPARQVAGPPALPVPVVRLSQQPNLMARILHGPSPLSRQPSNVELHQLGPVRSAKTRRRAGPH